MTSSTPDPGDGLASITWVDSQPATAVRIDSLILNGSPRLAGTDEAHVRLLAEVGDALPPIIVHRPSMRVIDGVHRVRAAVLNGESEIYARLLDCDERTAYLLAVKANTTHGLPLSQPDRAAAAARIIANHPQWSDRAVAAATGLSDKTVSKIRCRSGAQAAQPSSRLGMDGRSRPLDSGSGRMHAAAIINDRPEAGLREIARATGLSAATVRDVRQRINRGEDPVPRRYRPAARPQPSATSATSATTATSRLSQPRGGDRTRAQEEISDLHALLATLRNDPSMRFTEAGRQALRWLHHHVVDAENLECLGRGLPNHWAPVVAGVARSCATEWARFAERLERRTV